MKGALQSLVMARRATTGGASVAGWSTTKTTRTMRTTTRTMRTMRTMRTRTASLHEKRLPS